MGLDLQGGSYLLLEIDNEPVITQRLQNKLSSLRKYFKNENKYNKFVFNGYKSLKAYDYKNNCERYLNLINKINY